MWRACLQERTHIKTLHAKHFNTAPVSSASHEVNAHRYITWNIMFQMVHEADPDRSSEPTALNAHVIFTHEANGHPQYSTRCPKRTRLWGRYSCSSSVPRSRLGPSQRQLLLGTRAASRMCTTVVNLCALVDGRRWVLHVYYYGGP